MFIDICFPENNEKEFIETAKKLGTTRLIFVYTDFKKLQEQKTFAAYKVFKAMQTNLRIKNKTKFGFDLVISSHCTRKDLENKFINLHYDFENLLQKDRAHFRSSGLNHVLCNIMKQKEKIVGISFSNLFVEKKRAEKIGRIQQNIRLLRKYKINAVFASFAKHPNKLRSQNNLLSAAKTLGMSGTEAKKAINFLNTYFVSRVEQERQATQVTD